MRGQKLGCIGSETKGAKGSVQRHPCRAFLCLCEATRALLDSIVGHYLSWKLLVCAPEPWVLIVFNLSTPLPLRRFLLAAVPILFRFRSTTCLFSSNSTIPSQAVTPSTCLILLSLYQHGHHPFPSIVVWLLTSNSNAATSANLRLFIMGLPSCRN
jgi:hypothetical protein